MEGVEAKKAGKYTERNKKEQAMGLIKKSYGDVCMEKKEVAKEMIMMGAILRNMAVLLATGSTGFRFLFLLLSSILPLKGLSWRIPLPKRLKVF